MEAKQNIFRFTFSITVLFFCLTMAEVPQRQWNETVQSRILVYSELERYKDIFPTWKMKQMAWPSASEINAKKVVVDPNKTAECLEWLSRFVKKDELPVNLDKKLIAMKEWGLVTKETKQKRLCDVFITRFSRGPYAIHIQESPANIVITVANENCFEAPYADHKALLCEVANVVLNNFLIPNPESENFHTHQVSIGNKPITRFTWKIDSLVKKDEKGRRSISSKQAADIGTTGVQAETDGRFVKFEIRKATKGPRPIFDPYLKRF